MSRVGRRVEVEGQRGTVMFDGPVGSTKGTWLGVDWDDESRGKHDGSHEGVVYFRASTPTSGSFVRESKVNWGKSFIRVVRERYATRLGSDVMDTMYVKGEGEQITVVKFMGNEFVSSKQSRTSELEDVHVSDLRVSGFKDPEGVTLEDDDEDLSLHYPKLARTLGLQANLISSWCEVADIARPCTRLAKLCLDENRIPPPGDPLALADAFTALKSVSMAKMNLDWDSLVSCFPMWPFLEELNVAENKISTTKTTIKNSVLPPALQSLILDGNALTCWSNVYRLASPTLKTLSVSGCHLGDLSPEFVDAFLKTERFKDGTNVGAEGTNGHAKEDEPKITSNDVPSSDPVSKLTSDSKVLFPSVTRLSLHHNLVTSWWTPSLLSEACPAVIDLVFFKNPLVDSENFDSGRQLLIMKMPNLERIDHIEIFNKERRGAEYDYYNRFAADYLRRDAAATAFSRLHPCYDTLVAKFGAPEPSFVAAVAASAKPKTLKSSLVGVELSVDDSDNKPGVKKKIPCTMSVQKVKAMAARVFKGLNPRDFEVRVVSQGRCFLIDNELKEIGFYDVGEGDKLVLSKRMEVVRVK